MNRIGKKLKEARIAEGLSPKALGKKAGVSESYIIEVEEGRKIINENLAARLSKILGTDLNESGSFYEPSKEEEKAQIAVHPTLEAEKEPVMPSSPAPQWEHAFSNIIKDVPVYNESLSSILYSKKLVIQDNKVEGIPQDKAFYVKIEETGSKGLPIKSGDLVLVYKTKEISGPGIYLIQYNSKINISEIKPLKNDLLLLSSQDNTLTSAKTANKKEVKVLGKCIKAEIQL